MDALENLILSVPQGGWVIAAIISFLLIIDRAFTKIDKLQSEVWDLQSRIDELEANQEDVDEDEDDDW